MSPHWRDYEKLITQIQQVNSDGPYTVLLLSGSFNPVHKMHVQLIEVAMEHLKKHYAHMNVIFGYIAPSSDRYVKGKLKEQAIPLKQRNEMCYLATRDSEFIDVYTFGQAYAPAVADKLREDLTTIYNDPTKFNVLLICGADHCVRASMWTTPTICVSRPNDDKKSDQTITQILKNKRANNVHPGFIFVQDERMENISSTQIRTIIGSGLELPPDFPIHPDVVAYLKKIRYK